MCLEEKIKKKMTPNAGYNKTVLHGKNCKIVFGLLPFPFYSLDMFAKLEKNTPKF